jgi:hypothetical protein
MRRPKNSFRRLGKTRREPEAPARCRSRTGFVLAVLVLVLILCCFSFFAGLVVFRFPISSMMLAGLCITCLLISARRSERRRSRFPPPIPMKCPGCGGTHFEIHSSGLWDGEDDQGRAICGISEYGICLKCGNRCAQWEDGHPYVPTETEWQRHFEPDKRHSQLRAKWPFMPEEPEAGDAAALPFS